MTITSDLRVLRSLQKCTGRSHSTLAEQQLKSQKNWPSKPSSAWVSDEHLRRPTISALATAVVLEALARVEHLAHRICVANVGLPVVAILAEFVCDGPARIARLNGVATMRGRRSRRFRLERVVALTAAIVAMARDLVCLVELHQFPEPIAARLALGLREAAVKREHANAGESRIELRLHGLLEANNVFSIKLGAPLLGQQRHRTALLVLVVFHGHVLRALFVEGVVLVRHWWLGRLLWGGGPRQGMVLPCLHLHLDVNN